jgi:hypothetical protein
MYVFSVIYRYILSFIISIKLSVAKRFKKVIILMISFIKTNSNILIFVFLIFMTIDSFILFIKYRNYLESLPNIKISYDTLRSYSLKLWYEHEYKLSIINLTLENISTKPIDITNIKLIDSSKSYLATLPNIKDEYNENGVSLANEDNSEFININILSENILKRTNIPPYSTLSGYAVFENVEPTAVSKNYRIIIETPKKTFEKEITINPLNDEFQPSNIH